MFRNNKTISSIVFPISLFMLASCGTQIDDYKGSTPTLNLTEYFDGPVTAWGMVQDYNQKVTRRFCVELTGQWQEDKGVLAETFYFNDGEVSYRTWHLTRQNNMYTGSADDVTGQAFGKTSGFAFQWQYHLQLEIDGSDYEFYLDDWMFQIDPYRVFNRTSMKKFGIEVAELTLFFDKEQPTRQCRK